MQHDATGRIRIDSIQRSLTSSVMESVRSSVYPNTKTLRVRILSRVYSKVQYQMFGAKLKSHQLPLP